LRDDVDGNGYPHLYLVLGRTHTGNSADDVLLIKLTKDISVSHSKWVAIQELPNSTMVAIRGLANVTVYDGGE